MKFLDSFEYSTLIIFTVMMSLVPFVPKPHLLEKVQMLLNGTLVRPIDIFDLFFHSIPAVFLVLKIFRDRKIKNQV